MVSAPSERESNIASWIAYGLIGAKAISLAFGVGIPLLLSWQHCAYISGSNAKGSRFEQSYFNKFVLEFEWIPWIWNSLKVILEKIKQINFKTPWAQHVGVLQMEFNWILPSVMRSVDARFNVHNVFLLWRNIPFSSYFEQFHSLYMFWSYWISSRKKAINYMSNQRNKIVDLY